MIKKIILTSSILLLGFSISSCKLLGKGHHKKHTQKWFQEMDLNNNGFISRWEHKKFGEKKFKEIDTNKDGKLYKIELMDYKKNRK